MLPDSIDSSSPFLPSLLLFPDQSLCRQTKVRSRNLHSAQNSKWELARATETYRYRQVQVRSCSGPTLAHCHQSSIPVRARLGPLALPPLFSFSYDSLSAHESHCTICPHPVPPVAFGGQPLQQLEFPMFRPTHDCFYGIFWFSVAHAPPDNRNKKQVFKQLSLPVLSLGK